MQERTPAEVLRLLEDEAIEIVDVRFNDLPGLTHHFSVPTHELTEDRFTEGFGFDGSSIRGFQAIQESDMLLMPDPNTAVVDPFRDHKTLNINCFIHTPVDYEPYSRDRATSAARPSSTWSRPGSPIPPSSGPRPNSSSSTTSSTAGA